MTRCAWCCSILTNEFIKLSSLNSCALADDAAAARRQKAITGGTKTACRVGVARRRVIEGHLPSQVTTTAGSIAAPGRRPHSLVVVPAVAPVVVVVARARARSSRVVVAKGDVGIAGRTERGRLCILQVPGGRELLDAPAVDGLTREQVSPRIERDRVQEDEVACHVPGTAEPGEDVVRPRATLDGRAGRRLIERARMIVGPDDLVAAVDLEEEALVVVDGEVEVPSGSGRAEDVLVRAVGATRSHARAGDHRDDPDRLADPVASRVNRAARRVLLVHEDPIACAIAHVQVAVLPD